MNIAHGPILVVEDIPNVQELLEVTLRFKGYPVVTASNGQEALEKISQEHPSLVVTDILMPKMDGFGLAHAIRTNPLTNRIPVVFISATYITPEDKKFALSLGGVRFIEKPIDTEDFLLTVAEILTQGVATLPRPMGEEEFYQGYRERLESKLRYKNIQIARTERLLQSLPAEQKPAFEALLDQAVRDRNEIQRELDQLYQTLDQLKPGANNDGSPAKT
ncbi:MAG: response regulator [Chloroflexi bacterium]|nr:response regulator [Anaerolineaceae bacterium]NMB91180.1 response regulator [Chloroflexota bacterium]